MPGEFQSRRGRLGKRRFGLLADRFGARFGGVEILLDDAESFANGPKALGAELDKKIEKFNLEPPFHAQLQPLRVRQFTHPGDVRLCYTCLRIEHLSRFRLQLLAEAVSQAVDLCEGQSIDSGRRQVRVADAQFLIDFPPGRASPRSSNYAAVGAGSFGGDTPPASSSFFCIDSSPTLVISS